MGISELRYEISCIRTDIVQMQNARDRVKDKARKLDSQILRVMDMDTSRAAKWRGVSEEEAKRMKNSCMLKMDDAHSDCYNLASDVDRMINNAYAKIRSLESTIAYLEEQERLDRERQERMRREQEEANRRKK